MNGSRIKSIAREVFEIESQAISNLSSLLDDDFAGAVQAILDSHGKVIVTGIGKAGHIARKIAATLASTGTPSFFVHPAEAFHGDLGMFSQSDVVIALSSSGETGEVLQLIPFFRENGNRVIAICGNPHSTLANNGDFFLNVHVEREACPLEAAPTSSTTAMLAMGDALAIGLMKLRGFGSDEFARFHPGGSLGIRLLTKAQDVMRKDNLPIVEETCSMIDLIHTMSRGRLGLALVRNERQEVIGIITDGDLRRAMTRNETKFFTLQARDIMTTEPKSVAPDARLFDLQSIMQQHKINSLLVMEGRSLLGVVQIYDIPAAGRRAGPYPGPSRHPG